VRLTDSNGLLKRRRQLIQDSLDSGSGFSSTAEVEQLKEANGLVKSVGCNSCRDWIASLRPRGERIINEV
jgi:hypothetical protein